MVCIYFNIHLRKKRSGQMRMNSSNSLGNLQLRNGFLTQKISIWYQQYLSSSMDVLIIAYFLMIPYIKLQFVFIQSGCLYTKITRAALMPMRKIYITHIIMGGIIDDVMFKTIIDIPIHTPQCIYQHSRKNLISRNNTNILQSIDFSTRKIIRSEIK